LLYSICSNVLIDAKCQVSRGHWTCLIRGIIRTRSKWFEVYLCLFYTRHNFNETECLLEVCWCLLEGMNWMRSSAYSRSTCACLIQGMVWGEIEITQDSLIPVWVRLRLLEVCQSLFGTERTQSLPNPIWYKAWFGARPRWLHVCQSLFNTKA